MLEDAEQRGLEDHSHIAEIDGHTVQHLHTAVVGVHRVLLEVSQHDHIRLENLWLRKPTYRCMIPNFEDGFKHYYFAILTTTAAAAAAAAATTTTTRGPKGP